MKTCPHCVTIFPDSYTLCPVHEHQLSEIRELRSGLEVRSTYRILRKLGQGGMGSVYLADHLLMNEQRALKFLLPELSENRDFTSRFLREVKALHQLRHPNIIDCGDLERAEDGSLFFSMEYVDGPSLDHLMRAKGRLPVQQALEIASGVSLGLGAAHRIGLVHRDIKPENILLAGVGGSWQPKIADFGIVATRERATLTRTGGSLLSMPFASPEQWQGLNSAEIDGRADFYALGGLIFEMLTGRTAFLAENYEGWARQHLHTAAPAPSSLCPELAKYSGLDELVLRLLAKDREDRPKDVAELVQMMRCVARTPGQVTPPMPQPAPRPQSAAPPPAMPAPPVPQPTPAGRSSLGAVLFFCAVVALIGFGVWAIQNGKFSVPATDPTRAQTQPAQSQGTVTSGTTQEKPSPANPTVPTPNNESVPSNNGAVPNNNGGQQHTFVLPDPTPTPSAPVESNEERNARLERECGRGVAESCKTLAAASYNGFGVMMNRPLALQYLLKACNAGDGSSCGMAGMMYDADPFIAHNPQMALSLYAKGCQKGDAVSCSSQQMAINLMNLKMQSEMPIY